TIPLSMAARSTRPSDEIASRLTSHQAEVTANCAHVVPLLVLLKMPAPGRPSGPRDSPVPAYMMVGLAGLMTIDEIDSTAMKSSTRAHDAPPSYERQIPPLALPAKITFALAGLMAIERTRPPMLSGPSQCHRRG